MIEECGSAVCYGGLAKVMNGWAMQCMMMDIGMCVKIGSGVCAGG